MNGDGVIAEGMAQKAEEFYFDSANY